MSEGHREEAASDVRLWLGLAVAVLLTPSMAAATIGTLLLYLYEFPQARLPVRAGLPLAVLSAVLASAAAASGVRIARGGATGATLAAVAGFMSYVVLTAIGFLFVWFIAYDRNH